MPVRGEGDRDHGPRESRACQEEHRGGEREPREEPADARKAEQRHRQLVACDRRRAASANAPRDPPGEHLRGLDDRLRACQPLLAVIRQALIAYDENPPAQRVPPERGQVPSRAQPRHGVVEARAAGDIVSLDDRRLDAHAVVRGDSEGDPASATRSARTTGCPPRRARRASASPTSIASNPPSMFSCAWRLTITPPASPPRSRSSWTAGNAWIGPCSVPTRERSAPRQHEAACWASRAEIRTRDEAEQKPERARASRCPRP